MTLFLGMVIFFIINIMCGTRSECDGILCFTGIMKILGIPLFLCLLLNCSIIVDTKFNVRKKILEWRRRDQVFPLTIEVEQNVDNQVRINFSFLCYLFFVGVCIYFCWLHYIIPSHSCHNPLISRLNCSPKIWHFTTF